MQKFNIMSWFWVALFCSMPALHASDRGVVSNVSKIGGLLALIYFGYEGLGYLWHKALNTDSSVPKKGKTQSKIVVSPQRSSTEQAFAFKKTNRDLSPVGLKKAQIKRKETELQVLEAALIAAKNECLGLPVKIAQVKDDLRQYEQDLKEIIEKIKTQEEDAKKDDEALAQESCFPCLRRSSTVSPSSVTSTLPSFCLTPRSMQSSTASSISSSVSPSSSLSNSTVSSPLVSPLIAPLVLSSASTPSLSSSVLSVSSSSSSSSCYFFQTKK